VSGGKLLAAGIRGRDGSDAGGVATGVGAAPPIMIDGAESGAPALDGVLESVEALLPDSLESAVQDNIPSIASILTVNAAIRLLTRHIASLTRDRQKDSHRTFACRYILLRARVCQIFLLFVGSKLKIIKH
jgi:hypothetical protein